MSDELPEGWVTLSLDDVLEPGGLFDGPFGSRLKTDDYTTSGVRVIRLENVANLAFVADKETFVSEAKFQELSRHEVGERDIIVGSFVDGAVRVCVLPRLATKAIAKADCFCVRTRAEVADRKFVAFQLGRSETRDALVEDIHGATRPRITTTQLRKVSLTFPPPIEQQRIVERVETLLAEVSRAKARLDRVAQILKRFRQSVLAAAFSGRLTEGWRAVHPTQHPRTCGSAATAEEVNADNLPAGWTWTTVADLCDRSRAITYGVIKLGPPAENGIPTLRSSDVRWLSIDESGIKRISADIAKEYSRTVLKGGEVLVTVRGTLGGVAVVPERMAGYNISREVAVLPLLPSRNSEYLAHAIASQSSQAWLQERTKGAAYTGVNIEDLRKLPLPIAPVAEQAEIVKVVRALLSLASTIERRLRIAAARAENLPQAILAKAFSGELVPTEAELARAEGRTYESAQELLRRIAAAKPPTPATPSPKSPRARARPKPRP